MRGALAQKNKNQRVGPPKNNKLSIKFTMPQPGMAGQPGQPKKPGMGQAGQKRRPISAWEVPWTREEEDILKEAIDRFQLSGNMPIKTWHLHASILNSSIAARGRNRMGKHLKEYWEGRLQPDTPKNPPPYPERAQLSDPTRDSNIAAIIRAKHAVPVTPMPGHSHKSGGGGQKQRESVNVAPVHESHRASQAATLQQLSVPNLATLNPTELIRRKKAQAEQQASAIRQQAGNSAGRGGPAGPAGQQRMAHAGQVRQGVPGSVAGQKTAPGAVQAGRGVPGKVVVAGAPVQMAAGVPGQQLGHIQAGRGQVPVAAAGRGVPQAAGRAQIPQHGLQQAQAAQVARVQQHQQAMAASQMHRAPVQHAAHGHPQHHDPTSAGGHVPAPHGGAMQAGRGVAGGYVQQPGMAPGAAMPGQHPPGTMPMQQHPGMAAHTTQAMQAQQLQAQQAANARRATKKAPVNSPRSNMPPAGAPPKR